MTTRLIAAPATVALTLALAGCNQVTVRQQQVEEDLGRQLEALIGRVPDDIDCPGDLGTDRGTEMRCTVITGDVRREVTITVTGLDGTDVDFDIEVDKQPAD